MERSLEFEGHLDGRLIAQYLSSEAVPSSPSIAGPGPRVAHGVYTSGPSITFASTSATVCALF